MITKTYKTSIALRLRNRNDLRTIASVYFLFVSNSLKYSSFIQTSTFRRKTFRSLVSHHNRRSTLASRRLNSRIVLSRNRIATLLRRLTFSKHKDIFS